MVEPTLGSFWDAIRWWASSVGLLTSQAKPGEVPPRPAVPEGVCASCPICQAAATLEQVDPKVMADLTIVARSVMSGLSAALADAAMQRTGGSWAESSRPSEQPPSESMWAESATSDQRTGEQRIGEPEIRTSEESTAEKPMTAEAATQPTRPRPTAKKATARKRTADKHPADKPTAGKPPAKPARARASVPGARSQRSARADDQAQSGDAGAAEVPD